MARRDGEETFSNLSLSAYQNTKLTKGSTQEKKLGIGNK
jgi:hypothetical protein